MIELLAKRRSIRTYTGEKVCEEHIDALIQAALTSASSRGIRPWELVAVTEEKTIAELAQTKEHGSSFLAGAPLCFAVLGIPEKSDVWIEDAAIVSSNILLQAEALGLGACWIQVRSRQAASGESAEEVVRRVLDIPGDRSVEALIAVGHPDEHKRSYTRDDLHWEKAFRERYGS